MDNDKKIIKSPYYSIDRIGTKSDLATRGLHELGLLKDEKHFTIIYVCQFCGRLINYSSTPCIFCGDYPKTKLPNTWRAEHQKKILFSLREKEMDSTSSPQVWRAPCLPAGRQNKKCEENFSLVWRALASGGWAVQSFRSKWVRAKCIITALIEY